MTLIISPVSSLFQFHLPSIYKTPSKRAWPCYRSQPGLLSRLHGPVSDRFQRVVPTRADLCSRPINEVGAIKCKASSVSQSRGDTLTVTVGFRACVVHLQAEKRYLLEEIFPQWRHKAARVFHNHHQYDIKIIIHGMVKNETH